MESASITDRSKHAECILFLRVLCPARLVPCASCALRVSCPARLVPYASRRDGTATIRLAKVPEGRLPRNISVSGAEPHESGWFGRNPEPMARFDSMHTGKTVRYSDSFDVPVTWPLLLFRTPRTAHRRTQRTQTRWTLQVTSLPQRNRRKRTRGRQKHLTQTRLSPSLRYPTIRNPRSRTIQLGRTRRHRPVV